MSNTFCVIPWVQMACKPIGTARVCCLMTNSKDKDQGTIRDNEGKAYNFATDNFDEIKNGKKVRDIRLSLLKGEQHNDCITCWVKEKAGAPSKRTVSNKMYANIFTEEVALKVTDTEGFSTWEPGYWDLRFGNLCNLKCVMCHPASSSQWYEDYVLLNNTTKFTDSGIKIELKNINDRYKDNGEYSWWNNKDFWIKLESKIPFLEQVYLVGGEPMLIEPHYDFLEKIIQSGRANKVTLEYDTNLTAVHNRAVDLWKHFKKVWLRVSLDDYGDQFNYVRFPAKWSKVSENLHKLQNLNLNLKLDFTVTWQILTAFTTVNLLNYLTDYTKSSTGIRILSNPDYFDVAILPNEAKQELIKLYIDFDSKKSGIQVNHLINYLNSNKNSDQILIDKCINTLNRLDTIRKTNWRSTFVDLSKYI